MNLAIFDSIGTDDTSSVISAAYSLGQTVIANCSKKFEKFIDYIYADSNRFVTENARITSLKSDSCSHSTKADIILVIETILLSDNCDVHSEENLTAVLCERWIIRHHIDCLPNCESVLCNEIKSEIDSYFKSSPLWFWLKEHFQSKRYKLTHRMYSNSECDIQLGVPFQTTLSELLETYNSCSWKKSEFFPTWTGNPSKSNLNDGRISHREHNFPLISLGTDGYLKLMVFSPERMPSNVPLCWICITESSIASVSKRPSSDVNQYRSANNCRALSSDAYPVVDHTSNEHNDDEPTKQVVSSPVVMITKADRTFTFDCLSYPEPEPSSIHSLHFGHSPESATSTLTKKSKSPKPPLQQIESPPRKQQRIAAPDLPRDLNEKNARPVKALEEVIADLTQLNMEFQSGTNEERSPGDSVVRAPPCSTSLQGDTSEPSSNSPDSQSSHGQLSVLCRSHSSRTSRAHLSSERRRNATSSIIPDSQSVHQSDCTIAFSRRTGLPLQSSPVPLKRSTSGRFDFDSSLCLLKPAKSSTCMLQTYYPPSGSHPQPTVPLVPQTNPTTSESATKLLNDDRPRHRRRRHASLRSGGVDVNPPASGQFAASPSCRSRPPYLTEVDQAELSCSAPPSGDRNGLPWGTHRDRLVNTLACTPVSYGSSQHLLVNFEESMLNGRIHPAGQVDGFTLELGASGSFFPSHERLPLRTFFFDLSEDNQPSPYLGYADLSHLRNGKGYHIPLKGSVQLTLFNPNKFVVKMFVIGYDFDDMPPSSQTFLRQRTVYMPVPPTAPPAEAPTRCTSFYAGSTTSLNELARDPVDNHPDIFWGLAKTGTPHGMGSPSLSSCSCCSLSSMCSSASNHVINSSSARIERQAFLRYLVHLRFHTTRSGRLYLHTDLRLIFARDKFEFDPRVATYELRSFIDAPTNPRYSPKKWTKRSRPGPDHHPRSFPRAP